MARAPQGRPVREPLLHPDPPDVHPGERRVPVEAHPDERVAAQRRADLGARGARRRASRRADPRRGARLLPRASLPRVRQPRAPRRGLACREARGRRRARRRTHQERRLPRLRGRAGAARSRHDRGALREPAPDVRAHHRRRPVRDADADLPGRPLRDGRSLGRLRLDEQRARPLRAGRGELLGPRRQPPGRERTHAGSGRRLLRAPGDDQPVPRAAARIRPGANRRSGVHRRRARGHRAGARAAVGRRQPHRRLVPPGAREDPLGQLRHGPEQGEPREGARRDPRAARRVPQGRAHPGRGLVAEPVARESGPRRRLPGVRRAARTRRAPPRGELRWPLPRRAPDRRR